MSFDFNYKFWVATKKDINCLIKRQNVLKRLEPVEKPVAYKIFSEMYVLYVDLVNKLGYVYSNTYQVQKRQVLQELVEAATRRLMELKNELKNLELNEYTYTDKALIARKLTPYDLVVWRSPQFLFRRPPDLQNIIYDNKIFMDDEQKQKFLDEDKQTLRQAVIIIQSHERARRGRVYLAAIKYDKRLLKVVMPKKVVYSFSHKPDQQMSIPVKRTIFNADFVKDEECCRDLLKEENFNTGQEDEAEIAEHERLCNNAAARIQRYWRAYRNRKVVIRDLKYKQTIYGMKQKRRLVKPNLYADSIVAYYKKEVIKRKLDEDFIQLMTDERTRILQERSPWIMEDISDHIRAWFREFYDKTEHFHQYPEEVKTGTILVLIGETMDITEFGETLGAKPLTPAEKKKLAEKKKAQKKKEKEKKKKEKMKEAKRKKKMKAAGICDIGGDIAENKNIERIESTIKKYAIEWRFIDEYLNKNHEAIKDWVTENELVTVHQELRIIVDDLMRFEWDMLERARCRQSDDKNDKFRPAKRRKAKPKKSKKKKKKQPKDITADRTVESLYYELKESGIIETYDKKPFDDFIAEFNYCADDMRDENFLTIPGPAKGDIKMVIQESMLGYGEFTIDKPKSILIFGPYNTGKRLLCNIIASELDAVFMNVSPEKIAQYAEKMNYFLNIIMKVARAFQPAILFIENAQNVFCKKIPVGMEEMNPRLLQKHIMKKILKPIKKTDKIMLLGTADVPWTAKPALKKAFNKILQITPNDYGSSFLIWLEYLDKLAGDENVEDYVVGALANVMQPYASGDVIEDIENRLNVMRRANLNREPIHPMEFMDYFLDVNQFPMDIKIVAKYQKWFSKSNKMSKAKAKFIKEIEAKNAKKKK